MTTSKENISIYKKDNPDSKNLVVGMRSIQFAHQFTGGETSLDLLNLTTPSLLSGNGFVNASPSEIASAHLSVFGKNLKLALSRGLELKQFVHYLVKGNQIIFLGDLRDNGGALANEILMGEVHSVTTNSVVVGDTQTVSGTLELAIGQTTLVIGDIFKANAKPTQQIGELRVYRNGALQFRNSGNATASPSADGNYQEIDSGNGYGTQIVFNNAPVGQSDAIYYEIGQNLSSGDLNVWSQIERLQGSVLALAEDVKDLGPYDLTRYLTVTPSEQDRQAFGSLVELINQAVFGVGSVRQSSFTERKDNATFSSSNAIPNTTQPTITQGDQIFDVNFVPKKVGNRLLVEVMVRGVETSNASDEFNAALFVNNANLAITAGSSSIDNNIAGAGNPANQEGQVIFTTEVTATGNMNFKVRAAWNGGSAWMLNAHQSFAGTAYSLGGTLNSYIRITEIQA